MNRKIFLGFASLFLIIGLLSFGWAMSELGWDFTRLSLVKYDTAVYEINEDFRDISINTSMADIEFLPSDDGTCRIVSYERERLTHSVSVNDGKLTVSFTDTRAWYDYISLDFGSPELTVYLPEADYGKLILESTTGDLKIPSDFSFESVSVKLSTGDASVDANTVDKLKIEASTGDIRINSERVGSVELTLSTGDVKISELDCEGDISVKLSTGEISLKNTTAKNAFLESGTGDISLVGFVASEKLTAKCTTGDLMLDGSDAAEIFIKTTTGDVLGSLLSPKTFEVSVGTGKKEIPNTTGGKCEITATTGDVTISIQP